MLKKMLNSNVKQFLVITFTSVILTLILFSTYIYDYFVDGIVFSGSGDGFRQMMPFQMYLYEHLSSLTSLYDASFGLGGDYMKGLSYYYSLSPLMWLNFLFIKIGETFGIFNPTTIHFWPTNQLIMAMIRAIITFVTTFYLFKTLRFKRSTNVIATILYGMSTVVIYFNFTWSFYGNLLYLLPLSILGLEKYFQQRKIGIFIIAITLTLFSNFYFSYYQAIIIGCYYLYRLIFTYKHDIVSRKQKLLCVVSATILSAISSLFGLYTGVSAFLENDRQQNPNVNIPFLTPLDYHYFFFSDGFYITISIVTIVALLAFKLYRYYFYRLFAIVTWILFIGSLSQYFDSAFNGFSFPERRWVYILALSSSALCGLFIQHVSKLNMKYFLIRAIPVSIIALLYTLLSPTHPLALIVGTIILIVLALILKFDLWRYKKVTITTLVSIVIIQQIVIINENKSIAIKPYQQTLSAMKQHDYHSSYISQLIKNINHSAKDPLNRIDYMSDYALNSPFIYHYNGISLYSSIFNGDILNYYDKSLQINMPIDKNSTYRLLGNRQNLMSLWNVDDRIRTNRDDNLPYGFQIVSEHNENKAHWIHSKNTIQYPSAHITNKVFSNKELKSPLDKEQAMLQGVISNNANDANTHFKANKNLLSATTIKVNDATWQSSTKHLLKVKQKNGGLIIKLPKSVSNQYKDLYLEMDLELLSPDKAHDVKVNEYTQERNKLTYKYRRFVTPVTMRIKSSDKIKLSLPKGTYRVNLKGIYGEDYSTLQNASNSLEAVKVSKTKQGYTITKNKNSSGYIILPMTYTKGMHAKSGNQKLKVEQVNGVMTGIKVPKNVTKIQLSYTPPYYYSLIIISIFGIICSIIFTRWIKRK
ncbi:YfhO family protein [Staphylococcus sp. 30400_3112M30941]|nr:YfhO family protein [Staphylococcus sp. 30403_3112M30944]MBO0946004.1 YfhO family protein [Staphylococcus sp. 30402_3112M30943]MBO0963246.1 YfhO family protein [Staphylococcus sp. 30400_3112M30941]MBO0966412.1 YfhO family protein [Staphylococcus sp. 30401_3112M30942]